MNPRVVKVLPLGRPKELLSTSRRPELSFAINPTPLDISHRAPQAPRRRRRSRKREIPLPASNHNTSYQNYRPAFPPLSNDNSPRTISPVSTGCHLLWGLLCLLLCEGTIHPSLSNSHTKRSRSRPTRTRTTNWTNSHFRIRTVRRNRLPGP